ncbi:MAG TPA: histidine kinase [Verrucomicrobiae bacterium]|nr:histidine kinase [Verrucomicrobiae bacterium]
MMFSALMFWSKYGRRLFVKVWRFNVEASLALVVFTLLCGFVCFCANAAPERPFLTSAQQVREMSPDGAAQEYPVRLRGVVTYYDAENDVGLFLQDSTAAIFVKLGQGIVQLDEATNVTAGDEVEVEGITQRGDYLPVVFAKHMRILGRTTLPTPLHFDYEQLAGGREDCQWIELAGVVRSVIPIGTNRACLNILLNGRRLAVQIEHFNLSPAKAQELVCTTIRVQGVCRTLFNKKRQICAPYLSVTSRSDLVIEATAPGQISEMPLDSLAQFNFGGYYGQRIKVRGTVTEVNENSLFIQNAGTGLHVQGVQTNHVSVGDIVEVIGFPVLGEFAPEMEDAVFNIIGHQSGPKPVQVNSGQLPSEDYDNVLIQLRARLTDQIEEGGKRILIMETSNIILNAQIDSARADNRFFALQKGSELELTGVCVAQPMIQPVENWGLAQQKAPEAFQLLLRSPNDVIVVRNPPWWTLSRLFWLLGIVSIILLAGFCWVFELNRKVHEQTVTISEKVQREAIFEERTRIAREFHDTLEQELAAISIQLETADSQFDTAPHVARQMFELARNMTRHSLFEARRSVWDLRSHLLENSNLTDALSGVARIAGTHARVAISVESNGTPRKLPLPVENNLLRIAQEALANAVKHAQASQIVVHLEYNSDKICLRVIDDGVGFHPDNQSYIYGGHFGLQDMRERVLKMGGRFTVISAPTQGTEIRVEIAEKQDLNSAAKAESQWKETRIVSPPQL